MTRWLVIFGALLLLAAILYQCITSKAPRIESGIRGCVSERLADARIDGIEIGVDGRDVTLSGNVAGESQRRQAAVTAADGCGARLVTNTVQIVDLPPYETSLCVDGRAMRLRGNVPTPALREQATIRARESFGDAADVDLVLRTDAPEGFELVFPLVLREMAQLESGCMTLAGNSLSVAGLIRSELARDRLVGVFEQAGRGLYGRTFNLAVPQKSAEAQSCEAYFAERFEAGERVLFDVGSSQLHADGRALLDSLLARARDCSRFRILVTGHTDSDGDAESNRDLSLRRAQAVVDYLAKKGIDPDRMSAVGYGETQPRASNDTDDGKARNRRIEIRILETN
jgi:OmpA-OmpF porin, OOP family